jgi:hypothetical protein
MPHLSAFILDGFASDRTPFAPSFARCNRCPMAAKTPKGGGTGESDPIATFDRFRPRFGVDDDL